MQQHRVKLAVPEAGAETRDIAARMHLKMEDSELTEKIEIIQVEAAQHQLNTIDFELLSRESIKFKSKATLRLLVVIVIWGISEFSVFLWFFLLNAHELCAVSTAPKSSEPQSKTWTLFRT